MDTERHTGDDMPDMETGTGGELGSADEQMGEAVESQATGMAMGSAHGHFSYDEDTLKAIAKEWYSMHDDILTAIPKYQAIARLVGPGKDAEASGRYANSGNGSGRAFLKALQAQADYAQAQAEACRKAFAQYSSDESNAEDSFRKLLGLPTAGSGGTGGKLGGGHGDSPSGGKTEGKLG